MAEDFTETYEGWSFPYRSIECSACGHQQSVMEADASRGACGSCGERICIFCGCTHDHGCIHPDFPNGERNCEWVDAGVCSACNFRLIEEAYYLASGQPEKIVPYGIVRAVVVALPGMVTIDCPECDGTGKTGLFIPE